MNYNNQDQNQGAFYEQAMADSVRANGAQAAQATAAPSRRMEKMMKKGIDMESTISRRAYNLIMGVIILWGVGIDTLICKVFGEKLTAAFGRSWTMILIYLALVIAGFAVVHIAKNPIVSFLGYNLLVVGFGVSLAVIVEMYAPAVVMEAFLVTTIVTGLMLLLGQLWQDFFKKIGAVLAIALLGVIITEVVMLLITGTYPTWISVVSAIIFSGFIGYDWAKAQEAPATTKNAVLFATALYVDIINLFLDILRIVGDD